MGTCKSNKSKDLNTSEIIQPNPQAENIPIQVKSKLRIEIQSEHQQEKEKSKLNIIKSNIIYK